MVYTLSQKRWSFLPWGVLVTGTSPYMSHILIMDALWGHALRRLLFPQQHFFLNLRILWEHDVLRRVPLPQQSLPLQPYIIDLHLFFTRVHRAEDCSCPSADTIHCAAPGKRTLKPALKNPTDTSNLREAWAWWPFQLFFLFFFKCSVMRQAFQVGSKPVIL